MYQRVAMRYLKWLSAVTAWIFVAAVTVYAQSTLPSVGQVAQWIRSQQYSQALKGADGILAARPHDCRALSLRGLALNGLQEPDAAVQAFQQALRYCPNDLLSLEGAAQIEYSLRRPDAAGLLRRIVALYPNDVIAHAMLASVYSAKTECKAALPQYKASREMLASHPKFRQGYAYCLADTGDYAAAAKNYKEVLATDSDEKVRFNLALVQWKLHDAQNALQTLQPLLRTAHQEAVLTLGARLAEETGNIPLAVKLLRAAILEKPKNLSNYLEFAKIAFNDHSVQVGIDMINAGLTQRPDAARLYLARGVLEVQISKFDQAIADFERAHKLQPQLSLSVDALGIMESERFKQTAALKLYHKEARRHPSDSLLQYLYAEALSESASTHNSTTKAIAAAQHSVAANPDYAPVRDLLALLYLRMNKPHHALVEAQAALRIDPTDTEALYHEIMARRRLGQMDEVQKLVKKLAEVRRSNAERRREGHRFVLRVEKTH